MRGKERRGKFALNGGFVWKHYPHHYLMSLNNGHYILSKQCQYSQIVFLNQSGSSRQRQSVSGWKEIFLCTRKKKGSGFFSALLVFLNRKASIIFHLDSGRIH